MSEPPTTAKVILHTNKGPIEIELWAKETPLACRIFLESCLNNGYNNCKFNRIIPNFLIQIDNPQSLSIADEFNSRLKFNRRGLVGLVNQDKRQSNLNEFFITLNEAPELNYKNTLFGRVIGDTIFNVIKIGKSELNETTPLYPAIVLSSEVVIPYFDDLKRHAVETTQEPPKKKSKKKKVKLTFDDEDGEDLVKSFKIKSAHEALDDKRLSKKKVELAQSEQQENIEEKKEEMIEIIPEKEEESLVSINKQIEELESVLQQTEEPETSKENPHSYLDTEREKYSTKYNKNNKQLREMQTLSMLESFTNKLNNKASITSGSNWADSGESESENETNLDSLYNHKLEFDKNDANNVLANEQLIVVERGNSNQSKNEEFYRKRGDPNSILK